MRARDVILALTPPWDISVSNVLAARVEAIGADEGPFRDVRLDVGGTPLLARVTRQSAERLGLRPGMPINALVKAVSFDRGSLEFAAPDGIVHL
jgi:molybdate transport system ATP-binding protein